MSPQPARDRLRRAADRLPSSVRSRAGTAVRRIRGGRPQASVVVLLHGSEPTARTALDSARNQPLAQLQIVAVVMQEHLRTLAESAAGEDWRVHPVEALEVDWATARRIGALAAKTDWLLFLSPHAVLLPGALASMMAARTDHRAVLGQLSDQTGSAHPWSRTPLLGRILVPRALWEVAAADAEPDGQTAGVVLLSSGFVEVADAVLRDAAPGRTRLFERSIDPMPELGGRIAADRAMLEHLADPDGGQHLGSARATGSLLRDFPRFLFEVERADDDDWARLSAHAEQLMRVAGDAGTETLEVEDRVATWLAANRRREALVELVAARRFASGDFATRVVDGELRAQLEGLPEDVPAEILRLNGSESGLRAQLRRSRVRDQVLELEVYAGIRRLDQGGELPEVAAFLVTDGGRRELSVELGADSAVTRWMGEPEQYHDYGVLAVRLPLDLLAPGTWHLELEMHCAGVRRTGPVRELDPHGSAAQELRVRDRSLRWKRTPDGVALVVTDQPSTRLEADGQQVTVRGISSAPGQLVVTIESPGPVVATLVAPGQTIKGTRDGDAWTFALETDPWSMGPTPAPSASYRLVVTRDGRDLPVTLSPEVVELLPAVEQDELHRKALWGEPRGGLVLRLDPSLAEDVTGPWAQRRLQRRHALIEESVEPRLVYFQSFMGQSPTDHPAAIQAELHRELVARGISGVRMLWAVSDSSVRVPDGAEQVLMRSRGWYDALARAAWVVTNVELEPWFTRRDGQEVLETYHGYPAKAMGLGQWKARGLSPSHLGQMLQRTSGKWNNLLTPIPEMDHHYRENYDFDGRIISVGYPRDDALVSPGRDTQRDAVRRRLGIGVDQTAVLYAPTWRDDLATNFRRAEALLHLDVEQAAAALGPDYVVLLRGHRFHALAQEGAQVLDVTSYPEINDLILAADAAVLDYSSLRFDFALTGRPMVFLVPDLDSYTRQTRGFLYDFADSAPGPLLETTAQVVDALSDLRELHTRWAPRIDEFNATYNRLADGDASRRVVAEFFAPLLEE